MAKLNITQAAELAKVTRKTLYKHIGLGKVTFETDDSGNKVIDTAEILRVYGGNNGNMRILDNGKHHEINTVNSGNTLILEQKIEFLETQISDTRTQLKESKEEKAELREEVKRLIGLVEKNTLLLEAHEKKPQQVVEPTAPPVPEPLETPPVLAKKKFDWFWVFMLIMGVFGFLIWWTTYTYPIAVDMWIRELLK